MVYPNGCVKVNRMNEQNDEQIIDRKKNFFKLSQGEYIAAEKLELLYSQSPLVNQIFIYGDSRRSFLVSIVVADEDGVKAWAKQNSIDKSFEELCDSAELKAAMKADFDRIVKEQGLKGFERIRDFKIEKDQWTDENGLLTPTFKLKRPFVQKAYFTLYIWFDSVDSKRNLMLYMKPILNSLIRRYQIRFVCFI